MSGEEVGKGVGLQIDPHRFLTLPATPKSLILKEMVSGEESERLFQLLLYIVFLSLLEK